MVFDFDLPPGDLDRRRGFIVVVVMVVICVTGRPTRRRMQSSKADEGRARIMRGKMEGWSRTVATDTDTVRQKTEEMILRWFVWLESACSGL